MMIAISGIHMRLNPSSWGSVSQASSSLTACCDLQGSLLALDINEARLELVRKAALSQGLDHMIRTQATSLQDYLASSGSVDVTGAPAVQLFDRVLLDAPCSGTGVLGKRADLRWRRTPEQLQELIDLQVRLLSAALLALLSAGQGKGRGSLEV